MKGFLQEEVTATPNHPEDAYRAIVDFADPLVVMQRIVSESLRLIATAEGASVEVLAGDYLVYTSCAGSIASTVGLKVKVSDSLSGLALKLGQALYAEDTEADDRVDLQACRSIGIRSMAVVPLVRHGEDIGVLKVASSFPAAFFPEDIEKLSCLAEFVSTVVGAASELEQLTEDLLGPPRRMMSSNNTKNADLRRFIGSVLLPNVAHDEETRERIERTIARHNFGSVFQPIVQIDTGEMMGVEALTRFSGDAAEPPDRWFAAAQSVGMGPTLEIATMGHALKQLINIPQPWKMAVNLGPEAITCKDAQTVIERSDPQRLIVELTEHIAVDDYSLLRSSLQLLRDSGVLLAIDDTGAGFSSFSHIVKLSPDIIKLDIGLTRSIDTDPIKRSLAGAVARFADDIGACVIAEGVESIGELRTLMEFGITHAQGFLFSRPQSLEELMNTGIHDPLNVQMK